MELQVININNCHEPMKAYLMLKDGYTIKIYTNYYQLSNNKTYVKYWDDNPNQYMKMTLHEFKIMAEEYFD